MGQLNLLNTAMVQIISLYGRALELKLILDSFVYFGYYMYLNIQRVLSGYLTYI